MKKRLFLQAGAATVSIAWLSRYLPGRPTVMAASKDVFEITKSEEEWRKILTPAQFEVLRKHGTERAHTSPLDKQYGKGIYACAGCNLPLFSSQTKFNSGTGWPSFSDPIKGAIATSVDNSLFASRIEVHCHRCGGHLGHVFDDGPAPTGKRYCMNGVAMKFIAG
ncbi:peptide-methionine (R)-S-oxide reductase MsrB [Microcoleus sp. S28C3]|uniref:peptide-methionine (R)-S-oxide reductase MsrB n=1 Tax=Microcoleus sp. S28C3 TaxID=3055414 RepID=UPI002FD3C896